MFNRLLFILLITSLVTSCKSNNDKSAPGPKDGKTYFSVKQFAQDQWNIYHGQPFGLTKYVTMNGKKDSTLTNAEEMDWGAILKPFFDSDISDKKFLGHYDFSMFADQTTATLNLYYEAKDDNLQTRRLQVTVDDMTAKVRSLFVEVEKNSKWSHLNQKLLYIPLKVISIQESDHSTAGPAKELRVEYRFMQDDKE